MTTKGYTPIPGTARRYQTPSGETISRREYIKRTEGITPEQKRELRIESGVKSHMGRYNGLVRDYKRMNPGKKVRGKDSGEFKQLLKDLKSKDNSPGGRKARALEKLGRRSEEWRDYYTVGDSPD